MLIRQEFIRGSYFYMYDNLDEAIQKAEHLHKKVYSVSVTESAGYFYVESPASDFCRSWEIKHYYNGRRRSV